MSNEKFKRHIGQQYLKNIPGIIREEIIKDVALADRFGFCLKSVIWFENHAVTHDLISNFLHAIVNCSVAPKLKNVQGENLSADGSINEDGSAEIIINDHRYRFEAAGLLSVNRNDRIELFSRKVQENTLEASTEAQWRTKIFESELTFSEYIGFLKIIENSVESLSKKIEYDTAEKMAIDFNSLLPNEPITFHSLIGDPEGFLDFNDFSNGPLFHRRQELIQRDLKVGLATVGPGWLHSDENIVHLFLNQKEEDLINALDRSCQIGNDPFSLILVLEVCKHKIIDNEKYISIGESALQRLSQPEKTPFFQNFAIALSVVISKLAETGLLRTYPLFYQRLAAWTWAGFVARQLSKFDFDHEQLIDTHIKEYQYRSYVYGSLERRRAPYWRPDWITPEHLYGLINRHIRSVLFLFNNKNIPLKWKPHFERLTSDEETNLSISLFLPGPLDEFGHDEAPLIEHSEELENSILKQIREKDDLYFLAAIFNYSCVAHLPDEIIDEIKKSVEKLKGNLKFIKDKNLILQAIQTLTHLAGIRRDQELSEAGVNLCRLMTEQKQGATASNELLIIIDAASAYTTTTDAYDFIRSRIEKLAFGSLINREAKQCLDLLEILYEADPDLRMYLGRARSALSLAHRNLKENAMPKEDNKGDNRSITISGGRVGIVSAGDNAHIHVNAIHLDALPDDDADQRARLETLVAKLNELLRQAPLENRDEAEAVAVYTENLIQQAGSEKPNKPMLQITAKGMKEAAQSIAGVVPSAVKVVKEIADMVMGMVS